MKLGALNIFGLCIYAKLLDLETIAPDQPREHLRLYVELELRQILTILFEFLIQNNSEESMRSEFIQDHNIQIEEICIKAIKFSLDLQMVPIKKFLIIFQIYL